MRNIFKEIQNQLLNDFYNSIFHALNSSFQNGTSSTIRDIFMGKVGYYILPLKKDKKVYAQYLK